MPAILRHVEDPFARRLRRVRAAYGADVGQPKLTQEEFAARLNLNGKTYRRYERGESEPDVSTLANIHRLTGYTLDYLIAGSGRPGKVLLEYESDIPPGQLLRWAREARNLSIDTLVPYLNLTAAEWRRYEEGLDALAFHTVMHAAHLIEVTPDYVWTGWVGSIDEKEFQEALLQAHPELQEIDRRRRADPAGSHTLDRPGVSTGSSPRPSEPSSYDECGARVRGD